MLDFAKAEDKPQGMSILFFGAPMGAEGCPSLQALPQDARLVEPSGKGPNNAPLSSQAQASVEEGGRP